MNSLPINIVPIVTDYRFIPLSQGQVATVSYGDFDALSQFRWHAYYHPDTGTYYAKRSYQDPTTKRIITAYMSRQVLGVTDPKVVVDHLNHDTLNNTRWNLKAGKHRDNMANRSDKLQGRCSSRYTGVVWDKSTQSWKVRISANNKTKNLGRFESEELAHQAYQKALQTLNLTENK